MSQTIQVRSNGGITLMPIDTRLLSGRRLFLTGEIDESTADEFCKKIIYLNLEDPALPIDVWIDSPGGEIISGLKIYDLIRTSPAPVRTVCSGEAASMAAVIFACGTHGRYMFENSRLMLHEPLLGNKIGGNTSSVSAIAANLQAAKAKVNGILAALSGRTIEEIDEATRYDHFMDPGEAAAFGLCDGVTGLAKMLEV